MKNVEKEEWKECQIFERESWGNKNIYLSDDNGEKIKQDTYANLMGLVKDEKSFPIDLSGKSVLDIGAGPISLLLRSVKGKNLTIVEPLFYGEEVDNNYKNKNIKIKRIPAEEIDETIFYDEVWMYNCLQHTMNPELILNKIKKISKKIRIFEWINIPAHEGHPQELKEDLFVRTLDLQVGDYRIISLDTNLLKGTAIVIRK